MRTPGCGCIGHPAFPAPSDWRGRKVQAKSRARRAAEVKRMFAITWDGAAFSTVILRLVRNYALERAIQNCRDISGRTDKPRRPSLRAPRNNPVAPRVKDWIASSHPPSPEGGLRRTRGLLAMTERQLCFMGYLSSQAPHRNRCSSIPFRACHSHSTQDSASRTHCHRRRRCPKLPLASCG
jgi:hypothetical protein